MKHGQGSPRCTSCDFISKAYTAFSTTASCLAACMYTGYLRVDDNIENANCVDKEKHLHNAKSVVYAYSIDDNLSYITVYLTISCIFLWPVR